MWLSQVGDLSQLPVLTVERGNGMAPCYAVRRTVSPVRYIAAPRIGRARVGIEPGAMKPAQRIWSAVHLLGPGHMAPSLGMVSPVRQHSPPRCTGRAMGSIQPGRVGQAQCAKPSVRLHGPVYPVPPPRTRLSLGLLPTVAPACSALPESSPCPARPESPRRDAHQDTPLWGGRGTVTF